MPVRLPESWPAAPGFSYCALLLLLLLLHAHAGLRTSALKLPEASIVGVPHNYVHKRGLSDPSLMTAWMAAGPTPPTTAAATSNSTASSSVDSIAGSLSSSSSMSVDSDSSASGRSDVQVSVSVCSAEGAACAQPQFATCLLVLAGEDVLPQVCSGAER